jgi:transposase
LPQTLWSLTGPFDRAICRLRKAAEHLMNRFKQIRRMAMRYEKRAENSLAMFLIAAIQRRRVRPNISPLASARESTLIKG